jgi:hypothetical protein
MNATTTCLIITLSLVSISVPTQAQAIAASGSDITASPPGATDETTKSATPGTANPNEKAREMPSAGKAGKGPVSRDRTREIEERVQSGQPVPRDRTQEIEERVQSGQVDQKEVTERLEQLQSGSNPLSDETGTGHSNQ